VNEVNKKILQYLKQPWRLAVPLKRVLVFLFVVCAVSVSTIWLFENIRLARTWILAATVIWLAIAYYILPRIHRLLTSIYVPNYFIGRARTADGLLADPVNFALRGDKKTLKKVMKKAGWQEAEPITLRTGLRAVLATVRRQSYPEAPVSDLYVFGRKQDIAFQKEVDGNSAKRHHIRFWHVPKEVFLPGGYDVDWVGAATYDDAVGFSLFTFQITHSISGDVDAERDFVVKTIKKAHRARSIEKIEGFFPGYKHRNGGGHKYFTDGSMVIVDLKKGLLK
jgi:hypothetical protein